MQSSERGNEPEHRRRAPRRQSGAGPVCTARGARRLPARVCWLLLLLLGSALALGPQLGCRSPQTSDGAGGQSGDEGRRGPAPPAPALY